MEHMVKHAYRIVLEIVLTIGCALSQMEVALTSGVILVIRGTNAIKNVRTDPMVKTAYLTVLEIV